MKRYLLTASMLAFGTLAAIAPNASAQTAIPLSGDSDANAYFVSVAIAPVCEAIPIGLGTMVVNPDDPSQLSSLADGGTSAQVTVLCNVAYNLEADDANTEELETPLGLVTAALSGDSNFDTFDAEIEDEPEALLGLIDTREVSLVATEENDAAVQPGLYAFRVPLTLTTN